MVHIAMLGVGEVGRTLARDLMAEGVTVSGWDPNPRQLPDGLQFAESNPDAIKNADLILSANLAAVSVEVAQEVAPFLQPEQVYADMNTAAPQTKRQIAQVLDKKAVFTDVAILAPIAGKGLRSPTLASGDGAEAYAKFLSVYGMPIKVLDEPAGQAATQKLVRSIFYKGVAAVVIEAMSAAKKLNLEAYIREQMMTLLQDESMIDRFIEGSKIHAKRRIHEMEAVMELLQDIDVESYTSSAARQHLVDLLDDEDAQ